MRQVELLRNALATLASQSREHNSLVMVALQRAAATRADAGGS